MEMSKANGATPEGTRRYAARLTSATCAGHFREQQGLSMSSIGLGTYLGQWDERTDRMYQDAIKRAVELGCNVIDSAINYRFQRSERAIGATLKQLFDAGKAARDEIVIATKGGFFPFDSEAPRSQHEAQNWITENLIKTGAARPNDIVGSHCMSPSYLEHQLGQSLKNLGLETVDIYYVHNPESQLDGIDRSEFDRRVRAAFEFLERAADDGRIHFYGTATWNGYRQSPQSRDYLSLSDMVAAAREVGGEGHRFRVIQLPLNLAMPEALTATNQVVDGEQVSTIEAAGRLGVTVMCSGSIYQGQLTRNLPPFIAQAFTRLSTDAQRAIQFVRSTPGVTTALIGMSQRSHVEENMMVAKIPPAPIDDYMKVFSGEEA
jgi:aryl-alcohol dehydrogenase-like predicted oxidoreductase